MADVLWRHENPQATPMWAFLQLVASKYKLPLHGYRDLYRWSVQDVAAFWAEVWDFVGIRASVPYTSVLPAPSPATMPPSLPPMYPRPDFFAGARLNFAENLLFPPPHLPAPSADAPALISVTETADCPPRQTSWADLRDAVRRCAAALRAAGLTSSDVVAGLVANHEQALVSMLAAAAIGAAWTALSPDTGTSATLDRYAQIAPRVLIADDGALYNGKTWPAGDKLRDVMRGLKPLGLKLVIVVRVLANENDRDLAPAGLAEIGVEAVEYERFLSRCVCVVGALGEAIGQLWLTR